MQFALTNLRYIFEEMSNCSNLNRFITYPSAPAFFIQPCYIDVSY